MKYPADKVHIFPLCCLLLACGADEAVQPARGAETLTVPAHITGSRYRSEDTTFGEDAALGAGQEHVDGTEKRWYRGSAWFDLADMPAETAVDRAYLHWDAYVDSPDPTHMPVDIHIGAAGHTWEQWETLSPEQQYRELAVTGLEHVFWKGDSPWTGDDIIAPVLFQNLAACRNRAGRSLAFAFYREGDDGWLDVSYSQDDTWRVVFDNVSLSLRYAVAPVPVSPVSGDVTGPGTLTFHWQDTAADTANIAYHFQLARTPDFCSPMAAKADLFSNRCHVRAIEPGTYHWRVRAERLNQREANHTPWEQTQFAVPDVDVQEADVLFRRGWNVFSLPFTPLDEDADVFFALIGEQDRVWAWGQNGFRAVDSLEAGRGYIVFLRTLAAAQTREGRLLTVYGTSVADSTVDLMPGWHFRGPLTPFVLPADAAVARPAWTLDPGTGRVVALAPSASLELGKAYWLFADEPCSLDLETGQVGTPAETIGR